MKIALLAIAIILAGGSVVMTNKSAQPERTPEQAVGQFIQALLLVDANLLADSMNLEQSGEDILREGWGELSAYIDRRQPRDPKRYSWEVKDVKISPTTPRYATATVEYTTPDSAAEAEKILEIQGAQYDKDGRLTGFDPDIHISDAQAAQMAASDPSIPRIHYRVPVGLVRSQNDSQRWAVNPARQAAQPLLEVVINGASLESNQQYRVKP
ncbi:hypothetical protein GO986_00775 [Deinococcus sp. HMF7620]|uniref:Uncharacterized protein n=1 Tax=Deinococcus arboris TaxID=2682977 RepID=A0A7C9MP76_9DEIO|nr:hypothetical protein [Deinococcus arboris]MVN85304.1 hypothetical protein [Deinococcus arboris]